MLLPNTTRQRAFEAEADQVVLTQGHPSPWCADECHRVVRPDRLLVPRLPNIELCPWGAVVLRELSTKPVLASLQSFKLCLKTLVKSVGQKWMDTLKFPGQNHLSRY